MLARLQRARLESSYLEYQEPGCVLCARRSMMVRRCMLVLELVDYVFEDEDGEDVGDFFEGVARVVETCEGYVSSFVIHMIGCWKQAVAIV